MPRRPHDPAPASMIPRQRVLAAVNERPEEEIAAAIEYGMGAEVQAFAMPHVLTGDYRPLLQRVATLMDSVTGPKGAHGPFIDTIHCSPDPEVRALAKRRYLEAFDIAQTLGAAYVIFHSQYNEMIKIPTYPDIYHNCSMAFWPDIVNEAERRGLCILMENMFDADPRPMRRVAEALRSPRFGFCLDIAHVALHSARPIGEWIDVLGECLRHVHLNDSRGAFDDHLGLGQGTLDIKGAIGQLAATGLPLTFTLETNDHPRLSLAFLGLEP